MNSSETKCIEWKEPAPGRVSIRQQVPWALLWKNILPVLMLVCAASLVLLLIAIFRQKLAVFQPIIELMVMILVTLSIGLAIVGTIIKTLGAGEQKCVTVRSGELAYVTLGKQYRVRISQMSSVRVATLANGLKKLEISTNDGERLEFRLLHSIDERDILAMLTPAISGRS